MKDWEFVVVGAGPAGLSAALVASGNGVSTLVLEASPEVGGQISRADARVGDVLGQPVDDGAALAERLRAHARAAGFPIRTGAAVRGIRNVGGRFELDLVDGEALNARCVLVATGTRPRQLGVPGEARLARDAHARALANGLAGQSAVVVGGGDEAVDTARCLAEAGVRVTLLVRVALRARPRFADPLLARDDVEIRCGARVEAFEWSQGAEPLPSDRLEAVRLTGGERLQADAAFVRIGAEPVLPPMDPMPECHFDGRLVVDGSGQTSVPGLYAAGDVVRPGAQRYVVVACADGTLVGRAVETAPG